MRPKKHKTTGSNDLFRARLDQIINLKHRQRQGQCALPVRGEGYLTIGMPPAVRNVVSPARDAAHSRSSPLRQGCSGSRRKMHFKSLPRRNGAT